MCCETGMDSPDALKYGYLHCQPRSFTVRKSSLRGKIGQGLFARRHIPSWRIIGEYTGDILGSLPRGNKFGSEYVYETSRYYIDASKTNCPMKFINHQRGAGANVVARELFMDGRIFFISRTAIYPGQEIFLNYGKAYTWRHSPTGGR